MAQFFDEPSVPALSASEEMGISSLEPNVLADASPPEEGGAIASPEKPKKKKISPKKKSPEKKRPRKRRKKNRDEKVSEISQLRMDIADLIKKVSHLEKNQHIEHVDGTHPTLLEKTQGELDKKVNAGTDKIKLSLSGQLNRAALYLNNGTNSRLKHVDNDNSSSRFRFVGEGKVNDCFSVGTLIEIQAKENSSADVDINNTENATAAPRITTRHADVYFTHTLLGKLFVGQGSMVSDDTAEQDLSGTYVATQASGVEGIATGVNFVDKGTHTKSGITVGNAWTGMDGLSRKTRIRYDTPQILGTVLGVSHASSDAWDVAAKIKGDFLGYKLAGAAAYSTEQASNNAGYRQFDGSISVLTPVGLNLTFAGGVRNFRAKGQKTARYWLGRLGFKTNPFEIGDLCLAVDFGQQSHLVNKAITSYGNGSLLKTYGIALVQNIDKIATEAYITVRTYRLTKVTRLHTGVIGNPLFKPIWVAMAGARIKF